MSKASEYAKAIKDFKALERPNMRIGVSGDVVARVMDSGYLEVSYGAPMAPDTVLKFAHWILDTFGEEK